MIGKAPFILFAAAIVFLSATLASVAEPEQPKAKNCRMEQQCKWVNFKKICTWVKVCR